MMETFNRSALFGPTLVPKVPTSEIDWLKFYVWLWVFEVPWRHAMSLVLFKYHFLIAKGVGIRDRYIGNIGKGLPTPSRYILSLNLVSIPLEKMLFKSFPHTHYMLDMKAWRCPEVRTSRNKGFWQRSSWSTCLCI